MKIQLTYFFSNVAAVIPVHVVDVEDMRLALVSAKSKVVIQTHFIANVYLVFQRSSVVTDHWSDVLHNHH